MSESNLAIDLKQFIQFMFKMTCKVIKYENHVYEIYINDKLACHFKAMNLNEFKYYTTRFKLDITQCLIA
jgi:hypothetical protein